MVRGIYSLVIFAVLMVTPLASSVPSASAISEKKVIEQLEETVASATWSEGDPETDETCFTTSLTLRKINGENQVILRVATFVMGCSEESGALTGGISTTDEIFTIHKHLKSVSLPLVEIDLCDEDVEECTVPEKTVTVQAEWTGVGDIQKTKDRSVFIGPDNVKVITITEICQRDAEVTGTVDGEEPGELDTASLNRFERTVWQVR